MPKKLELYKCEDCEDIVEVIQEGKGNFICCDKPMKLLEPGTEDEGYEKHVPVIEKTDKGIKVKVGSVEHPMVESHFIQWIEVIADGKVYREYLKPGQKPEAEFCVKSENVTAREYCNIHGHWTSS